MDAASGFEKVDAEQPHFRCRLAAGGSSLRRLRCFSLAVFCHSKLAVVRRIPALCRAADGLDRAARSHHSLVADALAVNSWGVPAAVGAAPSHGAERRIRAYPDDHGGGYSTGAKRSPAANGRYAGSCRLVGATRTISKHRRAVRRRGAAAGNGNIERLVSVSALPVVRKYPSRSSLREEVL